MNDLDKVLSAFPVNLLWDLVMPNRKRMSSVDNAWLRMDSPHNLMMITGVMMFDARVDYARLKRSVERRFLKFKRFRQRPVQETGMAWWETDADFDIDHHVRRVSLPGKGSRGAKENHKAALENLVSDLAATPLDPDRPLWQFHLVENFGKASAIVTRIHHCYADGIALMAVMQSLTRATPEADDDEEDAEADAEPEPSRAAKEDLGFLEQLIVPATHRVSKAIKIGGDMVAGYLSLLCNPGKAAGLTKQGMGFAQEAAFLLTMPSDSETRYKGIPGITKKVAWADPIPLDDVKAIGKVLACSVNDVLLSCVAGALHDYLEEKGDETEGIEVRAMVPVNLRPLEKAGELGNQFGLVALVLPVGIANPLKRLYELRRRMKELKGGTQAMLAYGLLAAVGMGPKIIQEKVLGMMSAKATAVMTNVPGPVEKLYFAGAKIDQQMFWVPQSGNIGMGVSILSYGGGVQFGLITDRGLVPDPEAIIGRFGEEFEKLLLLTLMEPWDEQRDPEEVEQSFLSMLAMAASR